MAAEGGGDGGWAIVISLATMFVNAVIAIGGGIWALAHSRNSTDEKIASKERTGADNLVDLERRLRIEISDSTRSFGETVTAIRAKVSETELWNRDNFVNKDTFDTVIGDMRRSWERFEDKLNGRFDMIETKLDRNKDEIRQRGPGES
jgi:predicted nucleotidyltransferase